MDMDRLAADRDTIRYLVDHVIPFDRLLGIRALEVGDGTALLELKFRQELVGNPMRNALHGGAISSLLDVCGGAAVWSRVGLEKMVSTVDLRVDFLRPSLGNDLMARGTVVRLGNRVGVVELRAFAPDAPERPMAVGTGVYNLHELEAFERRAFADHLQRERTAWAGATGPMPE